jgi:Na+/H+ antiporter NhaD/arsenite permease-like protein
MFCGVSAVGMIALLMWGGWSKAEEHSIVSIFGWSLAGFILAMVIVIVGLLAGGPVGRVKVTASRDGATVEADGSDAP